jgi:Cu(I)/Ag(I) efflux system membrane fusion protein
MKSIFIYISIIINFLSACSADPNGDHQNNVSADQQLSEKTESTGALMLSDSQIILANITTEKVSLKPISQTIQLNSKLVVDEERSEVISSRITGRIERLFIKETGRLVKRGEPLYELYSETLLTLQREYLLALDQFELLGKNETRYESFVKAAEQKLKLYGLSISQVEELAKTKKINERVIFQSPASGIVIDINVSEGQYINEGTALYRLEDISQLWLEAELYPEEIKLVKQGEKVIVKVSGYEDPVEAVITFLSPEYRLNTQIVVVRASIKNSDMDLKPGMQAQVSFANTVKSSLAVPSDAVIHDQMGSLLFIRTSDHTFVPRIVKTGVENFNSIEITEGLMEGDDVVVTGAYLLYSELILKNGTDPMLTKNYQSKYILIFKSNNYENQILTYRITV